jgi:hypothetical protein
MAIDFTSPRHLTTAINTAQVETPFLLNQFFPSPENAGAETVDFEVTRTTDKRAKFVGPEQEAREVGKSSSKVMTVKIPTTFEKKTFTQFELKAFMPQVSSYISQREQASDTDSYVKREVEALKRRVIVRREDMAAQALFGGGITVTQDNYEWSVDYGYVADVNTLAKSGTAKWNGGSTCNILADIRTVKVLAAKRGVAITMAIMHPEVAELVLSDAKVMEALHNNNFRVGALDQTKYADVTDATYIGTLLGVELWMYSREYVADNGTATSMIPNTKVLFASKNNDNKLFYAPITRIDQNGLVIVSSGEMYLDSFVSENKRSMKWELEQKSLPAILNPDAFVVMTVVA